jgi:hypothetical protein
LKTWNGAASVISRTLRSCAALLAHFPLRRRTGGSAEKRVAVLKDKRLCCKTSASAAKRAPLLQNERRCCKISPPAAKRADRL